PDLCVMMLPYLIADHLTSSTSSSLSSRCLHTIIIPEIVCVLRIVTGADHDHDDDNNKSSSQVTQGRTLMTKLELTKFSSRVRAAIFQPDVTENHLYMCVHAIFELLDILEEWASVYAATRGTPS